jgi:hypothetical protein
MMFTDACLHRHIDLFHSPPPSTKFATHHRSARGPTEATHAKLHPEPAWEPTVRQERFIVHLTIFDHRISHSPRDGAAFQYNILCVVCHSTAYGWLILSATMPLVMRHESVEVAVPPHGGTASTLFSHSLVFLFFAEADSAFSGSSISIRCSHLLAMRYQSSSFNLRSNGPVVWSVSCLISLIWGTV